MMNELECLARKFVNKTSILDSEEAISAKAERPIVPRGEANRATVGFIWAVYS